MTALTLTAKETEMLVAVMSEMGEIPNTINFERVASRVEVKYARNARSSFKKLFDKLKSQAGPAPDGENDSTPPKTPSPTKKASPKKKVGPNNTPVKATPKSRGKKAGAKKEVKEEVFDSDEQLEEPILDDEDEDSF
ncbi:c0e850ee-66e3-4320-9770-10fb800de788 [Sclerotinia trifoliorum]|uniref:C0e850ee-66e3-4320-9770-10fb800de788 n=1 Tax=Sclerotinia trifoliorum TaxID=28548 RepID=A0A8H2W483_9HELO|nr:c0e850ee-66e3-4320-9770-10fb800de788 [Sclerotinia trifoliorum]